MFCFDKEFLWFDTTQRKRNDMKMKTVTEKHKQCRTSPPTWARDLLPNLKGIFHLFSICPSQKPTNAFVLRSILSRYFLSNLKIMTDDVTALCTWVSTITETWCQYVPQPSLSGLTFRKPSFFLNIASYYFIELTQSWRFRVLQQETNIRSGGLLNSPWWGR